VFKIAFDVNNTNKKPEVHISSQLNKQNLIK